METLEKSRVCRLCGKHAGNTVDIFDKRGNHVKKINSVLPILVHEMDLLPKHICHPCNCKLQEFHKFYENCLKTDANLKGQLSWMRGSLDREKIGVPMVQINNFMIKTEPPDYDDQDTTESMLHTENYANYVQNAYPERILPSNGAKCSRCGCYCGNRNRIVEIAKNDPKTRPARHNNEKNNNNSQFNQRDTIRRNLFATEIFGDKNPRVQTEIPICNITRGMIDKEGANTARDSSGRLERLAGRRNGGHVAENHKMAAQTHEMAAESNKMAARSNKMAAESNKMAAESNKMAAESTKMAADSNKMAAEPNKMAARTLRPRKSRAIHSSRPTSAPEATKKSANKSRSTSIDPLESSAFKPLEIKQEVCEDIERSLRPRIEGIDYSDSKRKNPLARNEQKRKQSAIKIDKKIANFVETVAIKVEPKEFEETAIFTEQKSRTARKTKIIFEEFLKSSIIEKMVAERNFRASKNRDFAKRGGSRRRNFAENRGIVAAPYLRSQRIHLRNGKMKTFESLVEKPKKIQSGNNAMSGVSLESIKRERAKSAPGCFKHRDCDMCQCRFASAELYMLHECYANKRH